MIARLPGWQRTNRLVLGNHFDAFSFLRVAFLFFIFLGLFSYSAFANNLSITNTETADLDTTNDTIDVEFDISWANSWKDNENYDAVWVFLKYCTSSCTSNGATWSHATLKTSGTNPADISRGSGTLLDVIVSADKKGAFIQRTGNGTGTVTTTNMQLKWDYGSDGVSDATAYASTTKVRVFGIEMVYVPEGPFYLGDIADGTANGTAYNIEFGGAATSLPGLVSSGGDLQFNTTAGTFYYNNAGAPNANDSADGAIFTLPATYPLGYSAFYAMKYEITEGQWVAFFNTLTANGQTNRDITVASAKNSDGVTTRNTIAFTSGTDATTTRADRAMTWLGWPDLAAYLDWAALSPMTEPQYEKAAKGPVYPSAAAQYAWGSTTISGCVAAGHSGTNDGTETCTAGACAGTGTCYVTYNNITFSNGLAGTDNQTGATRAGLYATGSTTTRAQTGASYWGIMDLTGNVTEMVVGMGCIGASAGNFTSRQFTGSNGDGNLVNISSATYDGNATNQDWPGLSTTVTQGITGTTAATGMGKRGGSWATTTVALLAVPNRTGSCTAVARANTSGGRGVRAAGT